MLSDSDLAALTGLACRLADVAGAASLPYFRTRDLGADDKGHVGGTVHFDPVTAADRDAEAAIRTLLAAERPQDGILGEEEDPTEGTSGLTWVIDPVDGTRAFISGLPTWGTLIALDDGETGRIGVVDQPHIGERFVGWKGAAGSGATLSFRGKTEAIAVRRCAGLSDATLYTTTPALFTGPEIDAFGRVQAAARMTRFGVDCYAYALVAMGLVDLVIETKLQSYDIAAPAALIQAAGGIVTDWTGGDARWGGQAIAAGDPRVHAEALEMLRGAAA